MGMGPAVKGLLIANVAVFVLQFMLLMFSRGGDPLISWFAFIPRLAVFQVQIWRFVSYMFLHADVMHILFNMFGLWMFGTQIEALWGQRTFLVYYFVCGIGGAMTYGIFSLTGIEAITAMIGASGALYGILLAYGVSFPNRTILLFFILPLKAKYMVIIYGLITLMSIPGGGNVAHLAHLGGMLFGLLFLVVTGGVRVDRLAGGAGGGVGDLRSTWHRLRMKSRLKVVRPNGSAQSNRSGGSRQRGGNGGWRSDGGPNAGRVDEILEKISREGLQSLTEEEQQILRHASKKK